MVPLNVPTTENLDLAERIAHREPSDSDTSLPEPSGLLDLSLLLAKNKRIVGLITLACVIIGAAGSLLIRNTYTAQSKILPPQQNQSALTALFGQAGGLSSLLGKDFGTKNASD